MSVVDIAGRQYGGASSSSVDTFNLLTLQKGNNLYVNEEGDKMRGSLDMSNNKIINVAEPTDEKDVSTKFYVDNAFKNERQSINIQFLDNMGLIRSDKLPPITSYQHLYIVNIGDSNNVPFKLSKFQIPLEYDRTTNSDLTPKYPKLTKQMIHLQITPLLNSDVYHDEIFMNIQRYVITYGGLDVYILTFRSTNTGWGLHLQAHLTLTIYFNTIAIINAS